MCKTCVSLGSKDPTRTTVLRNQFAAYMRKRFRMLNGLCLESIVLNDCFGIRKEVYLEAVTDTSFDTLVVPVPLQPNSVSGDDPVLQTNTFMEWLEKAEEEAIFQKTIPAIGLSLFWFSTYIRSAYQKGMAWARANLRKEYIAQKNIKKASDVGYSSPELATKMSEAKTVSRLNVAMEGVYSNLVGVTSAMNTQIRNEVLKGLEFGWSPTKIAGEISGKVRDIGSYRASLIARTEVIRAHHLASIQEYRDAGIVGVKVMAEFTTARDARVCPICASLDYKTTGKLWTLERIENMIPVHPNCRCAALPVVEE